MILEFVAIGLRTRGVDIEVASVDPGFFLGFDVEDGGAEEKVSSDGFCKTSGTKRAAGGGPDFGARWLNWLSRE